MITMDHEHYEVEAYTFVDFIRDYLEIFRFVVLGMSHSGFEKSLAFEILDDIPLPFHEQFLVHAPLLIHRNQLLEFAFANSLCTNLDVWTGFNFDVRLDRIGRGMVFELTQAYTSKEQVFFLV